MYEQSGAVRITFLLFFFLFLFYSVPKAQLNDLKDNSEFSYLKGFNEAYSNNLSLRLNSLDKFNLNSASAGNVHSSPQDLTLFSGIGNNFLNSFKGNNLYLQLAGIASTALIVYTNTDYNVEHYFNQHEELGNLGRPPVHFAMWFPFVIGGSLYAYGKLGKDDEALGASFAVLQSSLLCFLYNSLLKAITGRPHPDWHHNSNMKDLSKTFRFGLLRGGIYWGWPSGHTSSTMAVVAALTSFYPHKTWLKIAGFGYVAYMMFAVTSLNRGGMHWFSDAVAATFMSYTMGSTVGKFYRSKLDNVTDNSSMTINPLSDQIGFSFSIPF
jgi:membrane-associated phospholipid phosphatase